ncbi:MAG: winged helix DNA-binding protein [Hyphomicrobiales bacterium]|nr:winged helix DNA-binding protein [Hyphomicrobiales bacterium]MCP5371615.1 winged helix DNA-binding protein [Hyphomicrobiales bacterium]
MASARRLGPFVKSLITGFELSSRRTKSLPFITNIGKLANKSLAKGIFPVKKEYLELTRLIERLHRRFLDVLRAELNRMGVKDINGVQALLLANIGEEDIVIRDLVERGYYQGSNVSYNIKKLSEMGYLEQERSTHDRRSVRIKLTDKALKVVDSIRDLEDRHARSLSDFNISGEDLEGVSTMLRRLERTWTDYIHYGDL